MRELVSSSSELWVIAGWYVVMSTVLFVAYGVDKSAAANGRRRTPEFLLHALALAGGWPGALAAQSVFRHKTKKQPFRAVFWGTVAVNVVVLVWLIGVIA